MVNHLDPVGVGARDLRECLLIQICAQRREAAIVLRRRRRRAEAAAMNGAVSDEDYGAIEPHCRSTAVRHDADIFGIATHIVTNACRCCRRRTCAS